MEQDIQTRFDKIEKNLDKVTKRMDTIERNMRVVLDEKNSNKALYFAWGLVAFFAGALGIMFSQVI